jgi:hypothetical protein
MTPRRIILRLKEASEKSYAKIKPHIFYQYIFLKIVPVRDNYKQYRRAKQAKEMVDNINKIWCNKCIHDLHAKSREKAETYSLRAVRRVKTDNYKANYLSCHLLFLPCTFYLSLKQTNFVH